MIPQITEVNFPEYATLHEATVALNEMGERTITTQVRIDGDVVPEFDGWELQFKGERFILPIKEPQATKDNTTRNSLIDLTFYSWAIYEMKRYFFVKLAPINANTAVADSYNAPMTLSVTEFAEALDQVLDYYFNGQIVVDLYQGNDAIYSTERHTIEIDYTYIWDVLQKVYEIYGERWYIAYENNVYKIKIGYPSDIIDDHDFEYGYQGGLLKFERQVQDDNITNILLGRGGERNLPYRYFKDVDPDNDSFAADPDAIPELANIYYDRLRDACYRWYVRGWMQNSHRDHSWDGSHTFPSYSQSDIPGYNGSQAGGGTDPLYLQCLYAFNKGKTDSKFNPVEYVRDADSIQKFGEHWGSLDDNDDIYPTIQGVTRSPIGRVDEAVAISDIESDDIAAAAASAVQEVNVDEVETVTAYIYAHGSETKSIQSGFFEISVPAGKTANLRPVGDPPYFATVSQRNVEGVYVDTDNVTIFLYDHNGVAHAPSGLTSGTYRYEIVIKAINDTGSNLWVTFGVNGLKYVLADADDDSWKPTFDIWVKNIWNTTKGNNETAIEYAERVWLPILGDRLGNEAKIAFSDGFMAMSEDYNFTIVDIPVYDTSKTINGVSSEWKITVRKSDADFEATGKYVPSATGGKPIAGDHFYFLGIDMPFDYVKWAEEDLNGYKRAELSKISDTNPTWVIQLDKVRVHTIEDGDYNQMLADRLSTGAMVRTKDKRFTNNQVLNLYIRSITYSWKEPTDDNPSILPDIEVVLSDTISTELSPVQQVRSDLQIVKSTYVRTTDLEAVVRRVSNPLYLRKTGESDNSNSPTTFANKISSRNYTNGAFGGKGWGFYKDGDDNDCLELDRLIVRKDLQVNNLVINQISYVGGKRITSAAAMECIQVLPVSGGYKCFFDQKQGTVGNLFVVGDLVLGQVYKADNADSKYYRSQVTAIDDDSITISSTIYEGTGYPAEGDTIVQFGHISNVNRQYAIIADVIGGGYEQMLSGLTIDEDDEFTDGTEYFFAGRLNNGSPRFFIGDEESGYMEYIAGSGLYLHDHFVNSGAGPVHATAWCGPWVSTRVYKKNDEVSYTDPVTNLTSSYIYINETPSSGHAVTDTLYWDYFAKGQKGDSGDSGESVYRFDLTRENASVNCDADGNILAGAELPTCTATLYYGTTIVSNAVYSLSGNYTGVTINSSTGELNFSSSFTFGGTSLEIVIIATVNGTERGRTIMGITKSFPGANGEPAESYWLVLSADAFVVNPNTTPSTITPSTLTITPMRQVGANEPEVWESDESGSGPYILYGYNTTTPATEYSGAITVDKTKEYITIQLYKQIAGESEDTLILVRTETALILSDGATGGPGKGIASTNVEYAIYSTANSHPAEDSPLWSPNIPNDEAVNPGWYVWRRMQDVYTDGTTGAWRYDWTRKATDGLRGLTGPATLYMGRWQDTQRYYATAERCDIVYYEYEKNGAMVGEYFVGNPGVGDYIPVGTVPTNDAYWMPFGQSFDTIATGWIFAEKATFVNAVVRRLYTSDVETESRIIIDNNMISMYSGSDLRMTISGDDISTSTNTTASATVTSPIHAGTYGAQDIREGDYEDYAVDTTIESFTVTSPSNSLLLPELSMFFNVEAEQRIQDNNGCDILVIVAWVVNGIEYSSTSAAFSLTSSTQQIVTPVNDPVVLPATAITVPQTGSGEYCVVKLRRRVSIIGPNFGLDGQGAAYLNSVSIDITTSPTSNLVQLTYTDQATEIGANGLRVRFGSIYEFYAMKTGANADTVEFLIRSGNYGIKVTSNSVKYMDNGTWYNMGSGGSGGTTLDLQLNGATIQSGITTGWYAPTTAGTSGQTLISQGSGAPQWGSYAGSASQAFAVSSLSIGSGSSLSVSSGVLSVTGNAGVSLDDATHGSALLYSNGKFESDTNDDLGSASAPWGDVWANAFYVDYDMVNGEPWPIGFRYNSQSSYFELIGPTYFYGGDFLPMSSYQGNAVTKMLGNMYFYWDYAFVRNVIFNRDGNNVNRGLSWDGNNNRVNANIAIRTTANFYVDGTLNIGGASLYYDDEDGKVHCSAEIVIDET